MKPEISALMDGELDQDAAHPLIASLQRDQELQQCWSIYHQIGDSLRREHILADSDLQQKIFASLAAEPTVLSPRKSAGGWLPKISLALAASVATVGVVSWVGLQSAQAPAPQSVAVAQPAPARVISQPVVQTAVAAPVIVVNATPANVHDYLMAHQELSPASGVMQVSLGGKR